jgi:hypothetical protein
MKIDGLVPSRTFCLETKKLYIRINNSISVTVYCESLKMYEVQVIHVKSDFSSTKN